MKFKKNFRFKWFLFVVMFSSLVLAVSCGSEGASKREKGLYETSSSANDYSRAMNVFRGNYIVRRDDVFKTKPIPEISFTSSLSAPSVFGRSYNTLINDDITFVIRTPNSSGNYATIGVAKGFPGMNEDFVKEAQNFDTYYEILPYAIVDGMNEKGLVGSMSTFPNNKVSAVRADDNKKYASTGVASNKKVLTFDEQIDSKNAVVLNANSVSKNASGEIFVFMALRYALNTASSAKEAVEKLKQIKILDYPNKDGLDRSYHFHFADKNDCYFVEFDDGKIISYKDTFAMTDFSFISSSEMKMGQERYDLMWSGRDSIKDERTMTNLMKKLYYTNAYSNYGEGENFWYTECYTDSGLFKFVPPVIKDINDYIDLPDIEKKYMETVKSNNIYTRSIRDKYEKREDKRNIFSSSHISVYDLNAKTLRVITHESNNEFSFDL